MEAILSATAQQLPSLKAKLKRSRVKRQKMLQNAMEEVKKNKFKRAAERRVVAAMARRAELKQAKDTHSKNAQEANARAIRFELTKLKQRARHEKEELVRSYEKEMKRMKMEKAALSRENAAKAEELLRMRRRQEMLQKLAEGHRRSNQNEKQTRRITSYVLKQRRIQQNEKSQAKRGVQPYPKASSMSGPSEGNVAYLNLLGVGPDSGIDFDAEAQNAVEEAIYYRRHLLVSKPVKGALDEKTHKKNDTGDAASSHSSTLKANRATGQTDVGVVSEAKNIPAIHRSASGHTTTGAAASAPSGHAKLIRTTGAVGFTASKKKLETVEFAWLSQGRGKPSKNESLPKTYEAILQAQLKAAVAREDFHEASRLKIVLEKHAIDSVQKPELSDDVKRALRKDVLASDEEWGSYYTESDDDTHKVGPIKGQGNPRELAAVQIQAHVRGRSVRRRHRRKKALQQSTCVKERAESGVLNRAGMPPERRTEVEAFQTPAPVPTVEAHEATEVSTAPQQHIVASTKEWRKRKKKPVINGSADQAKPSQENTSNASERQDNDEEDDFEDDGDENHTSLLEQARMRHNKLIRVSAGESEPEGVA
jgi:hypothetical protein